MREYTLDEIMAHPAFAEAFRNELYGPGLEKEAIYGLITKGLSKLPFGSAGRMSRAVADVAKKTNAPTPPASGAAKGVAPDNVIPTAPGAQVSEQAASTALVPTTNKMKRRASRVSIKSRKGEAASKGRAFAEKGNAAEVTTPKPETVNVMGMDVKKDNLPYLAGAGLLGAGALGAGTGYVLGS